MESVDVLVLPASLFLTPDSLLSVVESFDQKSPVYARYGNAPRDHYAQVGWVDKVENKEDGVHGTLMIPAEGAVKLKNNELEVRGEVSLQATGKVIHAARLVGVKLVPKI